MKISDDEKARRMVEAFRPLAEMGKNPAAVALGKIKSAKKAKSSAVNGTFGGRPRKPKRVARRANEKLCRSRGDAGGAQTKETND